MADANSTATKFDPCFFNPLIESNYQDTITKVSSVLEFLSGALRNAEGENDNSAVISNAWGMSLILDTCRAALEGVDVHHA